MNDLSFSRPVDVYSNYLFHLFLDSARQREYEHLISLTESVLHVVSPIWTAACFRDWFSLSLNALGILVSQIVLTFITAHVALHGCLSLFAGWAGLDAASTRNNVKYT